MHDFRRVSRCKERTIAIASATSFSYNVCHVQLRILKKSAKKLITFGYFSRGERLPGGEKSSTEIRRLKSAIRDRTVAILRARGFTIRRRRKLNRSYAERDSPDWKPKIPKFSRSDELSRKVQRHEEQGAQRSGETRRGKAAEKETAEEEEKE